MRTINAPARRSKRGRYVVAMVLGTALSALGSTPALAASASEAETCAVSDLSRYCAACWRNARLHPDCWTDCTQEVFCRLLERVSPDAWDRMLQAEGQERREFLRAIDAVKKRTQRARKWSNNLAELVADRRPEAERCLAEEREAVQTVAAEDLSTRQRRIMDLSLEGWSVHDIAAKMQLPAERVSDEKYKAIRKLRTRLASAEMADG